MEKAQSPLSNLHGYTKHFEITLHLVGIVRRHARSREKETREPGQICACSLVFPRKAPRTYSRNGSRLENGYLGYLRYGKTDNKDIQLDLQHSRKRSRIAMLRVLPPSNQICLATNQFVAGCEKFLQKVESSSIFYNKI